MSQFTIHNASVSGLSLFFPRLVLRCRADARKRFAAMRSDVLVKLELLDNKHVQDIVHQVTGKHPVRHGLCTLNGQTTYSVTIILFTQVYMFLLYTSYHLRLFNIYNVSHYIVHCVTKRYSVF